jgi:hypothetical protein
MYTEVPAFIVSEHFSVQMHVRPLITVVDTVSISNFLTKQLEHCHL